MSDDLRSGAAADDRARAAEASAPPLEPSAPPLERPSGPRLHRVVLTGARLPADHGLSSLGLLMQLGGSVFVAISALASLRAMLQLAPQHRGISMLLALGLGAISVARSVAHRAAGTALLYGSDPDRAVRRYLQLAAVQTVAYAAFLALIDHASPGTTLATTAALAAWPLTLAVALRGPRMRTLLGGPVPVGEDKGFEGAAVLMVLLGLCGAVANLMLIVSIAEMPSRDIDSGQVVLIVLVGVLLIRSALHLHAGVAGMRAVHVDRTVEAAIRYTDVAGVMAYAAVGFLLLFMMITGASGPEGILTVVLVPGLLMVWPFALRRFFAERQFADHLAAERAPLHRRAPDQGLTALGWLLLALAGLNLAVAVPSALGIDSVRALSPVVQATAGHSAWWSVGVAALQLWAGVELVRMGDHHRIAATAYGVVSIATMVFLFLPLLRDLSSLGPIADGGAAALILTLLVLSMMLPVAAVVLVNRAHVPVARATIRSRAA